MSTPRPGESALSKAPIPYSVRPAMKQRLRPHRSVSLLHGIIRIAMISRKSVITVWTPFTVVSRSSVMSVIITFMFEPAKLQMNWASASGRINLFGDITALSAARAPLCATGISDTEPHAHKPSTGGGSSHERGPRTGVLVRRSYSTCFWSRCEKYLSAFFVFVSWSPERLMSRSVRKVLSSAAIWNASDGMHFVDSSRIIELSG